MPGTDRHPNTILFVIGGLCGAFEYDRKRKDGQARNGFPVGRLGLGVVFMLSIVDRRLKKNHAPVADPTIYVGGAGLGGV
jgi:hypothetical protein